jgi:hypothetical protein
MTCRGNAPVMPTADHALVEVLCDACGGPVGDGAQGADDRLEDVPRPIRHGNHYAWRLNPATGRAAVSGHTSSLTGQAPRFPWQPSIGRGSSQMPEIGTQNTCAFRDVSGDGRALDGPGECGGTRDHDCHGRRRAARAGPRSANSRPTCAPKCDRPAARLRSHKSGDDYSWRTEASSLRIPAAVRLSSQSALFQPASRSQLNLSSTGIPWGRGTQNDERDLT